MMRKDELGAVPDESRLSEMSEGMRAAYITSCLRYSKDTLYDHMGSAGKNDPRGCTE